MANMTLGSSTLYPTPDYKNDKNIKRYNHRMMSGRLIQYDSLCSYRKWEIPLTWVSQSDASYINDLWSTKATAAFNEGNGVSINVKVMNDTQPLNAYEDQYKLTQFRGTLQLEEII